MDNELTILRESGQRLCAIAVVTGVLACKKANPTISESRQKRFEAWRPMMRKSGEAASAPKSTFSSPIISASFPPTIPANVAESVAANRTMPPIAMVLPRVMSSIGRNILIDWKTASRMLVIETIQPTLEIR